ncbi:LuxR C-terminal-related transcriptional regulator [Saccharomonospora sp.]|uniref:LuxR C-terminal-related transcriptional regulator n=1 Tax=Saccharomonospora sp. TaxID=33913 RepID=UPI00260B38F5|nr:LuxR C-terminal-related transcriptional regulator [Saccharomonospora sp.]
MPRTATDVAIPPRAVPRLPHHSFPTSKPLLDEPTRELCTNIAQGALAPARLAVVAPGGHGKTAVLHHLARRCEQHGTGVVWFGRHDGDTTDLVLVDDAHDLTDADLAELRRLADNEATGLVVAARPWPRPATLNTVLSRLRGQVVLRPLDHRRIAALLGRERAALAEFVHAQTLGIPGFAVRLAAALGKTGDNTPPSRDSANLPESVLAEFRPDLDGLAPETLSLLLAALSGAGPDVDLLAGLLDTDRHGVARAIDAARACGLLTHDGTPLPLVAHAVKALVPNEQRLEVSQRLVRLQLDREGPVLNLVLPLLDSGLSGTEPAEAFEAAADEAAESDPALAAKLYSAAAAAGRSERALGHRWAEAAARSGELDTALRLADQVITDPDADDRSGAADTAATACVHKGQLERAGELYLWADTRQARMHAALLAVQRGRLTEAESLLESPSSDAPPTLFAGAMSALVRGLTQSVTEDPATALSTLAESAEMLEPVGRSLFLPDTPAAVGALVGMHCGELSLAQTLLERAIAAEVGGHAGRTRHLLLSAWIAMLKGDTDTATRTLRAAGDRLCPRDRLFAVALRAGVARRAGDLAGLRALWTEARETVIRFRVDLFTIMPFGELAIVAARLGERDRVTHHLGRARTLLHSLGDPPLWSASVHWSGLHAAVTADRKDEAAEHAKALARWEGHSTFHEALAETATCWLDLLGGKVHPAHVEAVARRLHATGLRWDAARLAGRAAIRTTDRAAMVALLECARTLQGSSSPNDTQPTTSPDVDVLSERERQVAELVVSGLTYRQVGDRLFISAKTVEHHMARMRQRLGATSRPDLLARLRTLVTTS